MVQLNPEIAKMLIKTAPELEARIDRFEKALFSGSRRPKRELLEIISEGFAFCAEHFKAGMGIDNPEQLSKWATTWNDCSILLGNYACSAPTLLIESEMLGEFLQMTAGRDYFFEAALSYIDEKKHKTLERLLQSGYEPIMDDYRLGLLCNTKDVTSCPRDLFEPFVMAGLKIAPSKRGFREDLRSGEVVFSLVGRYISCAQPAPDNLAAFKQNIFPLITAFFPKATPDTFSTFVQHGISAYPSAKALGITRLIMQDCLADPILLTSLIRETSHYYAHGNSYQKPFFSDEIKYSALPLKFFNHEAYFKSILNDSISDHLFFDSFPRIAKSSFDYTKQPGFVELQEQAAKPMLEIVSEPPSIALNAALILKLTPIENVMEAFAGPEGKVAQLIFLKVWPHLAEASDTPPIDIAEVAAEVSACPVEDLIYYRRLFDDLEQRKAFPGKDTETFDVSLLGDFKDLAKAKTYLESIEIGTMATIKKYCQVVAGSPHLNAPHADRFIRQVSWKNEAMRDQVFGGDLGL
ncbi:hypothetical protein [Pseudomonas amygdali]|uniref:Uncharacterized protein n=2 Tax=Pseudomonas amygdali pv. lachrymans TaxID=53707 RepID=A0ABR5KSK5_PSEAV|nr:hypothetical protein [Pseudomonas amygdali]AXH60099.1 hypothetical protein PLA107_033355 [Pseudomonas amygdali pv. lachrymans str. M301315]KPC17506.1 Uncharacterized protein AC499_0708 [Pseudomonas amygdali pv. lachrymans]